MKCTIKGGPGKVKVDSSVAGKEVAADTAKITGIEGNINSNVILGSGKEQLDAYKQKITEEETKKAEASAKRDVIEMERGRPNTNRYVPLSKRVEGVIAKMIETEYQKMVDNPNKQTDLYDMSDYRYDFLPIVDQVKSMLPKSVNIDVKAQAALEITINVLKDSEHFKFVKTDKYTAVQPIDPRDVTSLVEETKFSNEVQLPRTYNPDGSKIKFTYKDLYEYESHDPIPEPVAGPDVRDTVKYNANQRLTVAMDADTAVVMAKRSKLEQEEASVIDSIIDEALGIEKEFDPTNNNSVKDMMLKDSWIGDVGKVFSAIKPGGNFFLPIKMDWRMRFYYETRFINPQGVDFEKASILFVGQRGRLSPVADGWFKVHIANLAGKDKGEYAGFNKRIEWFDENIKSARDYHKVEDYPMSAIVALREYFRGNGGNVPVAVDSTTSGYQIASVLIGDFEGLGTLTNVGIEPNRKNDFYTAILNATAKITGQDEFLTRSVFKKPAMMYIYGSGDVKMKEYIEREYLKNILIKNLGDADVTKSNVAEAYARITDEQRAKAKVIGKTFLKVLKTDKQFRTIAVFRESLEKAISYNKSGIVSWEFPNGQRVTYNAYDASIYDGKGRFNKGRLEKQKRVVVGRAEYDGVKYDTTEFTPVADSKATGGHQSRGLPANFVQSVDAYLMHYVAARMLKQNKPFLGTHDSYSTSAEYVQEVQYLYLEGLKTLTEPNMEWDGRTFFQQALHSISGGEVKGKDFKYDPEMVEQMMTNRYHLS